MGMTLGEKAQFDGLRRDLEAMKGAVEKLAERIAVLEQPKAKKGEK